MTAGESDVETGVLPGHSHRKPPRRFPSKKATRSSYRPRHFLLFPAAVLLLYIFAYKYPLSRTKESVRFLYVYDFGAAFTDDVLELVPDWYSVQYDGEKVMTELFRSSDVIRTRDPEEATLFFVPFYSARFTLYHYKDNQSNMAEAVNKTSEVWSELLYRVRTDFPFFERHNGRDHFSFLTMDHGRCSALPFIPPSLYGHMFFLQECGDIMVRSNDVSTARGMQALGYNYGTPSSPNLPSIPCYLSDRDIIIPPMVTLPPMEEVPPGDKTITALFRFSPGQHHGVPIAHHNHLPRKELYELYSTHRIPGWDFGVKSEWDSCDEWRHANFCISPPGHSQWTSRPLKAILSGCIPVTFFREHDQPWQDEVDYEEVSVNVDPDDIPRLREKINAMMWHDSNMADMREAIRGIKEKFRWSGLLDEGVEAMIVQRLRARGRLVNGDRRKRLREYEM